eukprot:4135344-Prymnesium_polylepis.1
MGKGGPDLVICDIGTHYDGSGTVTDKCACVPAARIAGRCRRAGRATVPTTTCLGLRIDEHEIASKSRNGEERER